MAVAPPTKSELSEVAQDLGLDLDSNDLAEFHEMVSGAIQAHYGLVDQLPDELPPVKYPRGPVDRPSPADNPHNAWFVRAPIDGAPAGILSGKTVVLKDSICVADVPMMHGASILDGYVPDVDASVATRILDAGGKIAGKANCEYLSFSGGSHTCANGPVHNPHRRGYTSGGSSSGCAALVAAGEVDMAIGGDQAGSVRVPASMCGIYGMKPTFGLIPYSGVCSCEITLDTLGPMTATTADNAALLEAIAGADGLDPRQCAPSVERYTEALGMGVEGLRIGVVEESFGHPHSEQDVERKVREAVARFEGLGAVVEPVSLPEHRHTTSIWAVIAIEGGTEFMIKGNGFGTNWEGLYVTSLVDAQAKWKDAAGALPDGVKFGVMIGEYMHRRYHGRYYAKAQNIRRRFRAAYDDAFETYDILAMPTVAMKPFPLPPENPTRHERMAPALDCITNAAAFNLTGHPSMSIPCGVSEGLPIGLMLSGRSYHEATLYRAADAFETAFDWKTL